MNLNEAIEHLEDELSNPDHDWGCTECKEEHEQLLIWLKQLLAAKDLLEDVVKDMERASDFAQQRCDGICHTCPFCFSEDEAYKNCTEWNKKQQALKIINNIETEPMDNGMKPCPFCGKEPTLTTYEGKDGWRDRYGVLCRYDEGGCGAESGLYHSKEEAIDCWNRRIY